MMPEPFVNPYTFMSFPTTVKRGKPLGHAPTQEQAKRRYTGTIIVKWDLKAPLAIPNDGSWGLHTKDDDQIRIPGASVKGAVRSLHEALFAGCARILDPMYTPVYRDTMTTSLLTGWQLAVVASADTKVDGRRDQVLTDQVVNVVPCGEVSWTLGDAAKGAAAGLLPRTGDFIVPAASVQSRERKLNNAVTRHVPIPRGDGWELHFLEAREAGLSVILVTDTAARDRNRHYYWATAKPSAHELPVSKEALSRFRQRLRGASRSTSDDGFADVHWSPGQGNNPAPNSAVARRRTVDGWLRQGDVIWVSIKHNEVIDIKLSLGWRVPAGGSRPALGDRVPDEVKPCQRSHELCLSCVIFGSVDAEAKVDRDGSQNSYGGHVRFGDIVGTCIEKNRRRDVELAPLGTPHPGAGMYYLEPFSKAQLDGELERDDLPSRWDSVVEKRLGTRKLRGRKFYWHSDPNNQRMHHKWAWPRFQSQPMAHLGSDLPQKVHLIKRAELTQKITFDGLDRVALASLLASLNPSLLLGEGGDYALHLGRGKPLGLGSVQATVLIDMTTTADRYSVDPKRIRDIPHLDAALDEELGERCAISEGIKEEARKVLSLTGLAEGAVNVAYPPHASWDRIRDHEFHQSFKFFQEYSGKVEGSARQNNLRRKAWSELPLLSEDDQSQPRRPE